jgi:hypothetical protein
VHTKYNESLTISTVSTYRNDCGNPDLGLSIRLYHIEQLSMRHGKGKKPILDLGCVHHDDLTCGVVVLKMNPFDPRLYMSALYIIASIGISR